MQENSYQLPDINLLSVPPTVEAESMDEVLRKRDIITQTLLDFCIPGEVTEYVVGPRVTLFEITFPDEKDIAKVTMTEEILRVRLGGGPVRIVQNDARNCVDVEVVNACPHHVHPRWMLEKCCLPRSRYGPSLVIGETSWSFKPVITALAAAPHILICGAAGTGKTVLLNNIIADLLFQCRPDELKFLLIDSNGVEFDSFRNLPHLLTPVITSVDQSTAAVHWVINEIGHRYRMIGKHGAGDIREYNFPASDQAPGDKKIPYLVVIVNEPADLMRNDEASGQFCTMISCITQLGAPVGIHLIVATRPRSIINAVKSNFRMRICFQVRSCDDSKVVLNAAGAEKLSGMGDMLIKWPHGNRLERTQGACFPDGELRRLVEFVSRQQKSESISAPPESIAPRGEEQRTAGPEVLPGDFYDAAVQFLREGGDELFRRALGVVALERKLSTSFLQRRLGIGYNQASALEAALRKLLLP